MVFTRLYSQLYQALSYIIIKKKKVSQNFK